MKVTRKDSSVGAEPGMDSSLAAEQGIGARLETWGPAREDIWSGNERDRRPDGRGVGNPDVTRGTEFRGKLNWD